MNSKEFSDKKTEIKCIRSRQLLCRKPLKGPFTLCDWVFLSSQLDYMVPGGTVHIALATATAAAAATATSQMNGFHTRSLRLRQRQNKILKKTLSQSSGVNGPLVTAKDGVEFICD